MIYARYKNQFMKKILEKPKKHSLLNTIKCHVKILKTL
jgi:hypothetical protein